MALLDVNWEGYYPGHRDHLNEFFIPALSNSIEYNRITGDFSAMVLAIFADGLEEFVDNGGEIRIITGVDIFQSDLEAIRRGESSKVVIDRINWEKLRQGVREDVLEAFAWLIDQKILQLRFGIVTGGNNGSNISPTAKWHQKVAIFVDEQGNAVSVVGSPNESFNALKNNRESIVLNRSWVTSENETWDEQRKVQSQREEFEKLWSNEVDDARTVPLPKALEDDLLEIKPEVEPDWGNLTKQIRRRQELPSGIEPRDYQERAIERLYINDNRLIIGHATGTGKTWTSLIALCELVDAGDVVVILAPTQDLLMQWDSEDNLLKFFPEARVIKCYGGADWRNRLYNAMHATRDAPLFVVSTMHPSTMGDVFEMIVEGTDPDERILIADEVHNLGSTLRRGSLEDFDAGKARIGLSATPDRGDEGDEIIMQYFGREIDRITISDAIEDHGVLSPYKYDLYTAILSPAERDEYKELSDEIAEKYFQYRRGKNEPLLVTAELHPDLRSIIMKRAGILKECKNKSEITQQLIDDIGDKTLVYCNTKDHARAVKDDLETVSNRNYGLFLGEHTEDQRENFLTYFEDGFLDVLVSIDCLTEGVDVPDADSAILIANSGSEREAVQRRGRVLRKSESTDLARLVDFVVLPTSEEQIVDADADLSQSEVNMLLRELDRVERMNEAARNNAINRAKILKLRSGTNTIKNYAGY